MSGIFRIFDFLFADIFFVFEGQDALLLDFLGEGGLDIFFFLVVTEGLRVTFVVLSLLLLRLSLDFAELVLVEAVEALVVEVAFPVALTDFVEIIHVELNR